MTRRDLDPGEARPAPAQTEFEDERPWAGVPSSVLERLVHYLPAPAEAAFGPSQSHARFEQPFPLSAVQRGIWSSTERHQDEPQHIIPRAYRLRGPLDSDALARSLTVLIQRHEALRTTFALFDGSLAQVVAARGVASLRRTALADMPPDKREFAVRRLLRRESRRRFDLARGPVLRALLIRVAQDEHVLSLAAPLIAVDRWSLGLLWRELGVIYSVECDGREAALHHAPLQPAYVGSGTLAGSRLRSDAPTVGVRSHLDLPRDWSPRQRAPGAGGKASFGLDEAKTEALRDLAQAERGSLFMVLLAAYAALLRRYTGQDDLVIGTPVAHRASPELEGVVGCLENALAFRIGVGDDPTFRVLVGRARDAVLGTSVRQDGPDDQHGWDSTATPVQAALELERADHPPFFHGLSVERVPTTHGAPAFEISLHLRPRGRGLEGVAEYRTDLFARSTVESLLTHFDLLVSSALADPDRPIGALTILSHAERRRVLTLGRGPMLQWEERATVWSLFEDQSARTPAATALEVDGETRTYCDLRTDACAIARTLRTLGAGPSSRVGVLVDRPAERVPAILGVLAAGAAAVPLSVDHTGARFKYIMRDANLAVVLTDRPEGDWTAAVNASGATVVSTSAVLSESRIQVRPREGIRPIYPLEPAYVLYVDGSDGRPNGVVVDHRSVVNRLQWHRQAFPTYPGDGTLVARSSDASSLMSFLLPLTSGGRCVVEPEAGAERAQLAPFLASSRVAHAHLAPPALRAFVDTRDTTALAGCTALRAVFSDAAGLSPEIVGSFYSRMQDANLTNVRLHSLHGSPETTTQFLHRQCPPSESSAPDTALGRPIANSRVYVVDDRGVLCPVGVRGEVWVGGDPVARGYLGRGDLTAARFFPDPFAQGGRVHRTGDIARWRSDGQLEYLGRLHN